MKTGVIILPDPEMVLSDERLPPHDEIEAVSHLFGGRYPSVQSLIRARTKVEWALNQHVTQEQRDKCVPGCWVFFEVDTYSKVLGPNGEPGTKRIPIFGEIPDVEDLEKTERTANADDAHARGLRRRVIDAHNRGWLFGKWYSTLAPEGEWGAMHISTLVPMTQESFLASKARGWTP
jgi:hypothetical protein